MIKIIFILFVFILAVVFLPHQYTHVVPSLSNSPDGIAEGNIKAMIALEKKRFERNNLRDEVKVHPDLIEIVFINDAEEALEILEAYNIPGKFKTQIMGNIANNETYYIGVVKTDFSSHNEIMGAWLKLQGAEVEAFLANSTGAVIAYNKFGTSN